MTPVNYEIGMEFDVLPVSWKNKFLVSDPLKICSEYCTAGEEENVEGHV